MYLSDLFQEVSGRLSSNESWLICMTVRVLEACT